MTEEIIADLSQVRALEVELTPEEGRKLGEPAIPNVQAYECYLRARQEVWRNSEDALQRALHDLENGLNLVGENILLYAGLGLVYWQLAHLGIRVEEHLEKVEACVTKIFELESVSSHGYRLLGFADYTKGRLQCAIRNFKKVLAGDPNDPDALYWVILISMILSGKTTGVRPLIKRLFEIDPLTPINYCLPGHLELMETGRLDNLVELMRTFHLMDPGNLAGWYYYAWALAANGHPKEALAQLDLLVSKAQGSVFRNLARFTQNALEGRFAEAVASVTPDLHSFARADPINSRALADIYSLIGERERAMEWLENAINYGLINYPLLYEHDPFLSRLHGEPRFERLMDRVRKEWEQFQL